MEGSSVYNPGTPAREKVTGGDVGLTSPGIQGCVY